MLGRAGSGYWQWPSSRWQVDGSLKHDNARKIEWGMKRKDACVHQWVKGTPAFQIAEDERKKERLEHRASVDLSHMKECIERIWRLVRTFTGGASDICGIAAGPIPVLGGGKRRRERWRGPKQSAVSSSRSAFRTLGVAAIGQRYNPADEDLVGNVQGKGSGKR